MKWAGLESYGPFSRSPDDLGPTHFSLPYQPEGCLPLLNPRSRLPPSQRPSPSPPPPFISLRFPKPLSTRASNFVSNNRRLPNSRSMEHSGGSSRSLFLVLIILAQFALSYSEYPPAPSPSPHPPSAYVPPASTPAPVPITPPIVRNPSPAPSPESFTPSPSPPPPPTVSPSPGEASSIRGDGTVPLEPGTGGERGRSGGMRSGQKAGIAVAALVVAVAALGVGLVYKKRRENVRRAEYSYAIRRDIL